MRVYNIEVSYEEKKLFSTKERNETYARFIERDRVNDLAMECGKLFASRKNITNVHVHIIPVEIV